MAWPWKLDVDSPAPRPLAVAWMGFCDLFHGLRDVQCAGMFRIFIALVLIPCAAFAERPAKWAQPVNGHTAVGNFNKVTAQIYRSEQPDATGMRVVCRRAASA